MSFYPVPKKHHKKTKAEKQVIKIKKANRRKNLIFNKAKKNWERYLAMHGWILQRDGGCCGLCGSSWNTEVHHIIPKGSGGPDEEWNLITLCWMCHQGGSDAVHLRVRYWIFTLFGLVLKKYKGDKYEEIKRQQDEWIREKGIESEGRKEV